MFSGEEVAFVLDREQGLLEELGIGVIGYVLLVSRGTYRYGISRTDWFSRDCLPDCGLPRFLGYQHVLGSARYGCAGPFHGAIRGTGWRSDCLALRFAKSELLRGCHRRFDMRKCQVL